MRGIRRGGDAPVVDQARPGEHRNDWQTLGVLLPYLRAYKGRVVFAVACLVGCEGRGRRRAGVAQAHRRCVDHSIRGISSLISFTLYSILPTLIELGLVLATCCCIARSGSR